MIGEQVTAQTLSVVRKKQKFQYHPRSDRLSKIACWGVAVDLLETSALMQSHAQQGKITIGVNHQMVNFTNSRRKNLDLVIARPADHQSKTKAKTLKDIAEEIDLQLTKAQEAAFQSLPVVQERPVGSVLVALEAKSCMTKHVGAKPRLFDELNSSHQIIHGATDEAIAVGLAMVNFADTYYSPTSGSGSPTKHRQPHATQQVIDHLRTLPRRSGTGQPGFDAFGIVVLELQNDKSPVVITNGAPAPQQTDPDSYAQMITRAASLYDSRFALI